MDTDLRENYTPGWKFNHYELKGVPLRLELGPKDLKNEQFVVVRRDNGEKIAVPWKDAIHRIPHLLREIQQSLFNNAHKTMKESVKTALNWKEFMEILDSRCLALGPWCGETKCEKNIKEKSGQAAKEQEKEKEGEETTEKLTGAAKSLCIPFEQPPLPGGNVTCIGCTKKPAMWVLFGRSY